MGSGAFLVEACRQLGEELVKSWHVHGCLPTLPPDEDELLYAQRMVAQRCLYGVDKNPMAVDLAKLSLWLATLAKDHPFTFLDHSLRCGDSLVGLTREQIAAFHWSPPKKRAKDDVWFGDPIAAKMKTVTEYRQRILAARDDMPYERLRQELDVADEALSLARFAGDLVIAAFFSAGKDKQRVERLQSHARQLVKYMGPQGKIEEREPLADAISELRSGDFPILPFHWEIEFPEVFARTNAGFDAFLGNPPFLGCERISEMTGSPVYQEWLKAIVAPSKGHVDLSVYFYHRAFVLLRADGSFGLVATNTISYGDCRIAGLAQILKTGGTIFGATTAMTWPGEASVVVSVVLVSRCPSASFRGRRQLNGVFCDFINSRLQARKELGEPQHLVSNDGLAHQGTTTRSNGFTLELDEASRLLASPQNEQVILPLTGGEEVNARPSEQNRRFCISFGSMSLDNAKKWPEVLDIVRERVRPQRMKAKDHGPGAHGKKYWWQHVLRADPLYEAIRGKQRCLVTSRVSTHHAIRFETTARLFNEKVFVFAFDSYAAFAILQSRVHAIWSFENSSRLGFAINYSRAKTFDTFPFPDLRERASTLLTAGEACYRLRATIMDDHDEGLTTTYNRFHDPDEQSPDILKLRELHDAMDRAVLEAYGWTDIQPTCEFLLDYEEEEDEEPLTTDNRQRTTRRKKPWRYRWPDDVRDEVLARLLDLNQKRAEEEGLAGKTAAAGGKKDATAARNKSPGKKPDPNQKTMF